MTVGLRAFRRLALASTVILVIGVSPATAGAAVAPSTPAVSGIGHGYLGVRTNLRSTSHLSAWAIDAFLAANTPLPALGHAFKAAEAKYDVNALYLLAHAMHETNFGTSFIAQRYRNLFGYGAADRDPTGLALRFQTFAAGVDFVASEISSKYLSAYGRFYGGAPTLRGMHHYASDPMWADNIAAIANSIYLPTLAGRGVAFQTPIAGDLSTGQTARITVMSNGTLPDGMHATYRFVPLAIVEAGAPTGAVPAADPDFRAGIGSSVNGTLKLTVNVPNRPGRYRLELVLRDSDGTELTEPDVPAIPDATVRVYGSDAVTYALSQTDTGLAVTVTNVGRREIPVAGTPVPSTGLAPLNPPTVLTAWEIGSNGTPVLLGHLSLDRAISPGHQWTAAFATPDPASLPAILIVRMSVGGDPARLGGSPPGVFRMAASGPSLITPATDATTTPDPNPSTSPDPAASPDPAPPADPAPAAAPSSDVDLDVGDLTPVDAVTRVLLNPAWKPAPITGKAGTSARATAATTPALRLAYLAMVNPRQPGALTLRITNLGTATLDGPLLIPAAPGVAPAATDAAVPVDVNAAAGSVVSVTAVPAWGPATEPMTFQVPLPASIAPGRALDLPISLPSGATGQSTFLVAARVIASDGTPASLTLFWLRSALPTLRIAASFGVGSGQSTMTAPAVETLALETASPSATPAPTVPPTLSPTPAPTPAPTPVLTARPAPVATPRSAPPSAGPRPGATPTPLPTPTSTATQWAEANVDTRPIVAAGGLWEARNALFDAIAGTPHAPATIPTVTPGLIIAH